jgi:hypothetical protein
VLQIVYLHGMRDGTNKVLRRGDFAGQRAWQRAITRSSASWLGLSGSDIDPSIFGAVPRRFRQARMEALKFSGTLLESGLKSFSLGARDLRNKRVQSGRR